MSPFEFKIPPYGFCGEKKLQYYERYTEEACNLECRNEEMIRLCDCKREYIQANDTVRTCDQYDINDCEDMFIYDPGIHMVMWMTILIAENIHTFSNIRLLVLCHYPKLGHYQLCNIYITEIKEKYCNCPPECFKVDYDVKVAMAKVSEGMQTFVNTKMEENLDLL